MTPVLDVFTPVLARLQTDAIAHFGLSDARLVPLGHEERPFSYLLRVAVCGRGADAPDRHVFVKIFKPKRDASVEQMRQRVAHDFDVTRRVSEALASYDDLGAVRPVACYVEHLAIVTEQAAGETLLAHLQTRARWFPSDAMKRQLAATLLNVGRWLRAFQAIEPTTALVALADLRAYIDLRLERLVTGRVLPEPERTRILRHLDALAERVSAAELESVLVHSDFAMGNILVAGPRIVVLDLAMTQHGASLHDISRLYLQLDVLRAKPQFRPAVVRLLQEALLRGFDESLTPTTPLFRYLLMLHRVNHLGTLSLNRESFPGSVVSHRVQRLHRRWIDSEAQRGAGLQTS